MSIPTVCQPGHVIATVARGYVDGIALCCMFNTAIARIGVPKNLSSDNDPLFTYHRWLANLRI